MGKIGSKLGTINILPQNFKFDPELMKAMAAFGFYIALAGLFGMLNQSSDVNFIRRIWGDDAALLGETYYGGKELVGFLLGQ